MIWARSSLSGIHDMMHPQDPIEAWRQCLFPTGSSIESIDSLHAELALADSWVAEDIVPFLERGMYKPDADTVMNQLSKLEAKLLRAIEAADMNEKGILTSYLNYCEILEAAYSAFLTIGS